MLINVFWDLYQLRKSQWLNPKELKNLQEKRLRNIIRHAYKNVKFYHKLFDSIRLKPDDIKNVEDLQKIPILTKQDVQKKFTDMIATGVDINKCKIEKTSGSTGMPLNIVYDRKTMDFSNALIIRAWMENGLKLTDKIIKFGDPSHFPKNKSLLEHFGLLRTECISVFNSVEDSIKEIQKISPDAIYSYPSYLKLIAKAIKDIKIDDIYPRLIFTSSEILDRQTRKLINSVFKTETCDFYGSMEFMRMSWECNQHSGYHIDADAIVMEFVQDGENVDNEKEGEIIVTGLYNYAMPLIRYNIGDVGTYSDEQCSCGRGLPLMKNIKGRENDFFVLPSGRIVSPMSIGAIDVVPGPVKWRIIQEKKDKFNVYLVKEENFSTETIKQIKNKIKEGLLGEDVDINIKIVDDIKRDNSGKFRAIISKVKKR
jgi:phenylacetate-CoA ligase